MQEELLAKRRAADVKVYAIYFEVVPGDEGARSTIDPNTLFDDRRVMVFWDDDKVAGRWFEQNVTKVGRRQGQEGRVEWDAFILYGANAKWGERGPESISWGRTLFQERDRLARDLDTLLHSAQ